MSVRYRLFLVVSALFVVVALCSYFIENIVTRRGLQKAQVDLRAKILDLSEKHRLDLQDFLASVIAEDEEQINSVLTSLSSFNLQVLRFGPTMSNQRNGTWGEAADLLLEHKWIDFLQNTNEGEVTAEIIPKHKFLDPAYRIEIDADLTWVYVKERPIPYLGIRIPYSSIARSNQVNLLEIPEKVSGIVPEAFLLFDVQSMMAASGKQPIFQGKNTWPSIQIKWMEGVEIDIDPIVEAFQRAHALLSSKQLQMPQLTESEVQEKMDGLAAAHIEKLNTMPSQSLDVTGEATKERLQEIALNYTQISLIWAYAAIYDSGIFGDDLFHFPTPDAITIFSINNAVGLSVDREEILFSQRLFDDSGYFLNHSSQSGQSNLATSLAVIALPERLYLGNTAQFVVKTPSEDRVGYLTLGVNADVLLQKLLFAMRQTVLMVHANQVFAGYTADGKKLQISPEIAQGVVQMLGKNSGVVPWKQENYFFMHIQPFPNVDLHFILLNPESVQFALLNELQKGSRQIVNSILLNIHIAGLVALLLAIFIFHQISKKITKPIIQLAKATKEVAEGRLDEIQLNLPPLKHNDEIALLCHSFEEMVTGLKEKEKVKGVLNKVVSTEIAQEILKGNVHLGGEEKKVTVLFADIRDFTKMTQNMLPQQIIELLNGCMTKISYVIDKNGGVIDKYVGDEAMALFGAPISREDAALKAIICAMEMIETLKKWNLERMAENKPPIEMGIGIHTGMMLAGNMGAENRLNYTVIGSNVNLASRLCNAAKRMEILITKDTLEEPFVKEKVICEALPPMTLRGIDKPIEIFRVKV